jgi:hypothetical protein
MVSEQLSGIVFPIPKTLEPPIKTSNPSQRLIDAPRGKTFGSQLNRKSLYFLGSRRLRNYSIPLTITGKIG